MIYIDIYCYTVVESGETQLMPAPDKWSVLYTAAAAATYMSAVLHTRCIHILHSLSIHFVYIQYKPCHLYARYTLSIHSIYYILYIIQGILYMHHILGQYTVIQCSPGFHCRPSM